MLKKIAILTCTSFVLAEQASATIVPSSVPPVRLTTAPLYADPTRGIAVPEAEQFRLQTGQELLSEAQERSSDITYSDAQGNNISQNAAIGSVETAEITDQLDRIANDPGVLSVPGQPAAGANMQYSMNEAMAQMGLAPQVNTQMPSQGAMAYPPMQAGIVPTSQPTANTAMFENVNTGFRTIPTQTGVGAFNQGTTMADGNGVEIAVGKVQNTPLDIQNSLVKLREDRASIRRVVRRMLDQIGGGSWNIVWSLSEENANLPDMEISIYTQEPFMNVLNALLARLQTRSGQSLRVIKYDNAQKIVITDQQGPIEKHAKAAGVNVKGKMVVTEQVLKDSKVVLHYDEIPLVDALENIVNQASKGQWKLRVYAGMDQVLRPAHIEEPFNIAMERILTLFNLKYEVFPGGKLVVVTSANRASDYANMQQR